MSRPPWTSPTRADKAAPTAASSPIAPRDIDPPPYAQHTAYSIAPRGLYEQAIVWEVDGLAALIVRVQVEFLPRRSDPRALRALRSGVACRRGASAELGEWPGELGRRVLTRVLTTDLDERGRCWNPWPPGPSLSRRRGPVWTDVDVSRLTRNASLSGRRAETTQVSGSFEHLAACRSTVTV